MARSSAAAGENEAKITRSEFRNQYLIKYNPPPLLSVCSCTNVLLHHRGSKQDYDEWGNGWSGDEVLPYFLRTQDDRTGRVESNSKYHSTGGEWTMSEVRYQNPLSKKFLEVGEGVLGKNDDFNDWDRQQDGVGRFQVSERNGCRESGATAFLEKALKREVRTKERS